MAILESPAPAPAARSDQSAIDRSQAAARRDELAAFLRNRRERLTPDDVGIVTSGRRRTPGLRREEVAQLAGVGVTWYTWLEQGRDIAPSPQVLDAIVRTLRLDGHERTHVFRLSGATDPTHVDGCAAVPDAIQPILDQLQPFPAVVVNGRYDILAYNRTYQAVIGSLDDLPVERRNMLRLMFTDPEVQSRMVDRDRAGAFLVASFRASMAKHVGEPAWKCFLADMLEVPEFAKEWERHEVRPIQRMSKRIFSPSVGLLHMESTSLWLAESVGVRMVTYVPTDDETRARLDRLYAELAPTSELATSELR
jgi:transcriptional regulator with XRE-family HTH domain